MNLDSLLFKFINQDLANPVFDVVMPFITNLNVGLAGLISLLLLVSFIYYRFRKRTGWVILGLVLAVGAVDMISYRLIKPNVQRLRPSMAGEQVELRVKEHSGYSFPSNHAANSFAGATLLALALPSAAAFFLSYAFLVSFSRVYVGVHYPLDILAGAILGALVAAAVYLLLRRKISSREAGA